MEKVIQFQSLTQARYLLKGDIHKNNRVYILNHGFMSTPQKMMDRFEKRLPEESLILAPCGPFPVPVKEENGWRVGYSWYFYDDVNDEYLINYDICQNYMSHLLKEIGLADHKKTIIGFSQGGYSAVHMVEALEHVTHLIGIGCRFKIDQPQFSDNLLVEALHGEDDNTVGIKGARESFLNIPEKNRGRFQGFEGVTHRPSGLLLDTAILWCKERSQQLGEDFD